jgi:glycosyltransferase involved in cell wall biosynthesis
MNDESHREGGLRAALVAGTADAHTHAADPRPAGAGELVAQLTAHGAPDCEVALLAAGQLIDAMAARRYDVIHIATPPRAALPVLHVARTIGVPVVVTCDEIPDPALAALYRDCETVLSPSAAIDAALTGLGVTPGRIERWQHGVDVRQFNPARYAPDVLDASGRFNVLHAGPLDDRGSLELLAEAFLLAHDRQPRLHLVLGGAGTVLPSLAARLGAAATNLAGVGGDRLAQLFATADLFLSTALSHTGGPGIAEAQASGVPVLAVDCPYTATLVENGRSGLLLAPDPQALAFALRWLARRGAVCERLATGGLMATRDRSWEHALDRLAGCWRRAAERGRSAGQLEVDRAA